MKKEYNAFGIVRIAACAADLVSMIANGTEAELKDSIAKIYETTRAEFPKPPVAKN